MRTTIEMKPAHRTRLLELASIRGEKGFSSLIAEALDVYFELVQNRAAATRAALAQKGTLTGEEADQFLSETERVRSAWR